MKKYICNPMNLPYKYNFVKANLPFLGDGKMTVYWNGLYYRSAQLGHAIAVTAPRHSNPLYPSVLPNSRAETIIGSDPSPCSVAFGRLFYI